MDIVFPLRKTDKPRLETQMANSEDRPKNP